MDVVAGLRADDVVVRRTGLLAVLAGAATVSRYAAGITIKSPSASWVPAFTEAIMLTEALYRRAIAARFSPASTRCMREEARTSVGTFSSAA